MRIFIKIVIFWSLPIGVMAAPFNLECSTNDFESVYTVFVGLESDKPETRKEGSRTFTISWDPELLIIREEDSLLGRYNFYIINRETLRFSGKAYDEDLEGKCRLFENKSSNKF
jgi:hypothetical protein